MILTELVPTTIVVKAAVGVLSILLLILLLNLCMLLINLRTFRRLRSSDNSARGSEPFVSILIPARNEEDNIEKCLHSLIKQNYGAFEIMVLDDQSTDNTAIIIQNIMQELSATHVQLIKGAPLPAGWIGKNHACQQLAQHAQGEYLLFTDADTLHQPEMLRAIIQQIQSLKVKLLTAQPEQIVTSLGERLVIPLLNFTILTLLPVELIYQRREPSLAIGNGQMLCFERTLYHEIGGHAAVKDRILEDVSLARKVKAAGYRMAYVDAFEMIQCHMYHSLREVWDGFSKNLYTFYNYSLPFALGAMIFNLLLFVAPPILLISAVLWTLPAAIWSLALGAYLLAVFMRVLITYRFTRTQRLLMYSLCLLHPISIILECLILCNSICWHYRKTGIPWKGRRYIR